MQYLSRIGGALALAALAAATACNGGTIRLPSSANSTLSLVPTSIVADGTSEASIQLLSADGTPVPGASVTVEIDGGGVTITQPSVRTGFDGIATATISVTRSGEHQIRVVVEVNGESTVFTLPGVLTVQPAALSAGDSQITIDPATLPADGLTPGTVTVEARDAFGNPISGAQVALALDVAQATFGSAALTTDDDGNAQTTILSATPGDVHVMASITAGTDIVAVTDQPVVHFAVPQHVDEVEPNDDPAQANTLFLGTASYGSVLTQGDVDTWRTALHAGDNVKFELFGLRFDQANWTTNGNRPRLTVWNSDGTTKIVEQDYSGNDSDNPWYWDDQDLDIPLFMVEEDGVYLVTVTTDDSGSGGGGYALRMTNVDLGTTVGEGTTLVANSRIKGFHLDDESDDFPIVVVGTPAIVQASTMGYRMGVNHRNASVPDYYDMWISLYPQSGGPTGVSGIQNDDQCYYDSGLRAYVEPGTYTYTVTECCGSADAPYISDVEIIPFTGPTESEPNNDAQTAMLISDGAMVTGATTNNDYDYFAIQVTAGDILRFDLLGAYSMLPQPGQLDNVEFAILDSNENTRATTSSTHRELLVNETGTWYLQVRAQSSAVAVAYAFRVQLSHLASEVEPNDDIASASVTVDADGVCGTVTSTGDIDVYRFTATADELIHISVVCNSDGYVRDALVDTLGSDMVAQLIVRDDQGSVIAIADGSSSGYPIGLDRTDAGCEVAFRAPAAGTYFVNVVDVFDNSGDTYFYVLRRHD